MLYTSAQAAKLLRKLNDTKASLEAQESQASTFQAAISENIESARPPYNYSQTQAELDAIDSNIRKVKHAINTFNLTHDVPGFNMTIDQLLVYIPQLTRKKAKLAIMKNKLPKTREFIRVAGIIEYSYTNYDVEVAKHDYDSVSDELARAQTALDVLNNSVQFEIDL